ncbi:MAG: RNA-binding protein [Alphaproteobacteria bacterium]|nr:RNA-binding protein [Alphaproteobacteria bacterium]
MLHAGTEIELDAEPPAASTQRRCIASGAVAEVDGLIRFVVGPDAQIVPDVVGDLPGRGIWVTAAREQVDFACSKKLFGRAAKTRVEMAPDLSDRIEALLLRRCIDLIGLSRRGGGAIAGYDKVRSFVMGGEAGLLLAAADGAKDGREKIRWIGEGLPVVDTLDRFELGRAFGREQAVHAAMAAGRLAKKVQVESARLANFRLKIAE